MGWRGVSHTLTAMSRWACIEMACQICVKVIHSQKERV